MNANKLIVSLLIGIVLLGLGALVGYGVGKEQAKLVGDQKANKITQDYNLVPRSKLFFGKWTNNVAGNVTEITPTSITVETKGEKLSALTTENTDAIRKVLNKDGVLVDSSDALVLSDVKVGDFVNVIVSANDKGNLLAERIFVIPIPPGTPPSSQ